MRQTQYSKAATSISLLALLSIGCMNLLPAFADEANKTPSANEHNVPDWLKQYDKTTPAPSTNSQPTAAGSSAGTNPAAGPGTSGGIPSTNGSGASASVNSSTTESETKPASSAILPAVKPTAPIPASAPPPSGHSVGRTGTTGSATLATPRPAEHANAPTKPVKMLTGRLEEIGGNGATLPVGVMLKLKAQSAKSDPRYSANASASASATTIQGQVASFPIDWRGAWNGQLKIHGRQASKLAYEIDAEETTTQDKILVPGTMGSVTFDFSQRGRAIYLEPAQIVLPQRTDTSQARATQQQLKALGLDRMLGGNGSAMLQSMTASIPVLLLGEASNARGVTGNIFSSQVLKNDIRELKPGVLEQNIVVNTQERKAKNGNLVHSVTETVIRFTKLNPSQLYVQAASVQYAKDGQFETKVLMYGTVNRGQASAGPLPGAFPGMPASGGGGLGDLNNLLKNLQGF